MLALLARPVATKMLRFFVDTIEVKSTVALGLFSRQPIGEGQAMEREGELSAREVEAVARQHATGGGWSSGAGDKFPVLTAMAMSLRIIGWLAVVGGVLLAFLQVLPWFLCITGGSTPTQGRGFSAPSCGVAMLILAPMLGSFAIGFCLIAFGEIIGVFRAIEGNTHQLISSVEQAWNQIKLTGEGRQS
jgi:hypothetical protein